MLLYTYTLTISQRACPEPWHYVSCFYSVDPAAGRHRRVHVGSHSVLPTKCVRVTACSQALCAFISSFRLWHTVCVYYVILGLFCNVTALLPPAPPQQQPREQQQEQPQQKQQREREQKLLAEPKSASEGMIVWIFISLRLEIQVHDESPGGKPRGLHT